MDALPPQLAMQMAMTRQNVAVSVIKQNADAQRQMANILAQAVQNVPVSGRGGIVNTSA
jgi:transcriptional regulator